MTRSIRLMAVTATAVLALAMPAMAAQAKAAKPAKAKTMTISGTLQKADAQSLTVQTPKGAETVMLMPTSTIRRAGKAVTTADLGRENGSRVTVRYMENNGQKMAQSVTLGAAAKAASAAPKTSASAPPKAAAATVAKK